MSHQSLPQAPLAAPKPHGEFVRDLLAGNASYTSTRHTAAPTLPALTPGIRASPSRTLLITCSDPRLDVPSPTTILGLPPATAVVVRDGGGSASQDALRSLLAIDSLIPFTDVVVLKHTDCGSTYYTDAGVKAGIRARVAHTVWQAEGVEGMTFKKQSAGMEDSVRRDVRWLREHPLVREELRARAVGFLYDIETGEVKLID